jgi:peptide/nickel transport system permease protein
MSAAADSQLTGSLGEARPRAHGSRRRVLRRLGRQPVTLASLAVLIGLLVVGAFAHELAPKGWNLINLAGRWQNHAPTFADGNLFGTDNLGRSILVRTLWALHFSEQVAITGALLALAFGLVIGAVAGYYGGLLDAVLMRLADLVSGFPVIILMLVAFAFLHPVTVWTAMLVFALSLWTFVARVVRAKIASLRSAEFVEAARALGASDLRILVRHILPNATGTLVVAFTSLIGQIVMVEATVEFFGFGIDSANLPTLGNLIAGSTSTGIGIFNAVSLGWWAWGGPALVLVLLLISVNLAGDGIEAALDPRRRQA